MTEEANPSSPKIFDKNKLEHYRAHVYPVCSMCTDIVSERLYSSKACNRSTYVYIGTMSADDQARPV